MTQTQRSPGMATGAQVALRADASIPRPADIADALRIGYEAGYSYALAQLAERYDDLDFLVRPIARPTPAQRHAARVAEYERSARTIRFDDPDWPPVAVPGVPGVRLGPANSGEVA
jgi:hypothetical protein